MSSEEFNRRIDAKLIISIFSCGIMSFAGITVETAMNITFPALMEEFSVSTGQVQWITTGYLLVLTAIMPLSAFFKRRFRTKTLFAVAISLFIAGTVVCMVAPVFPVLVAGRVIQGFGTGLALPLTFNIVLEQAPYEHMGLMMSVAAFVTACAPAAGPSLGGAIITFWGWRAIFGVLLPFLMLAMVGGISCIRQASKIERVGFSAVQFTVLAAAFACIVFAASVASTAGWLSVQTLGLLAGFFVLVAVYAALARRSSSPLIRIDIFRNVKLDLSAAYVILMSAVVLGLGYLIPYYAQVVYNFDEMTAGFLMFPACIMGAILAPMTGHLLDRFGAAKPIVFGGLLQLLALVLFNVIAVGNSPWVFMGVYFLIQLSQACAMANTVTNGLHQLPDEQRVDGNAVFNTLQQLGNALGTAVVTSIMNAAQVAAGPDLVAGTLVGTQQGFAVLMVLSVCIFASVLGVFVRRR